MESDAPPLTVQEVWKLPFKPSLTYVDDNLTENPQWAVTSCLVNENDPDR